MDTLSKASRSELMSRIRGDSLKPESRLAAALEARGGLMFFRNVRDLPGKPDFVVEAGDGMLAVFVDGCFWHSCPAHWRMPKSNTRFWAGKFKDNRRRDRRVRRELRSEYGCATMTVWEHDLKTEAGAARAASRIANAVNRIK